MMKRILALVLVLIMMTTSSCASSLFPDLGATKQKEELAPSYGVMVGKQPYKKMNEQDGTVHCYDNVPETQYNAFGSLLLERGYQAVHQEIFDNAVIIEVEKGEINFKVGYLIKEQELQVLYPYGVKYEKLNPFADYKVARTGQPFTLAGTVQITVNGTTFINSPTGSRPAVEITLKNISQNYLVASMAFTSQLHMVTESENHYQFDMFDIGRVTRLASGSQAIGGVSLSPLESENVVCVYYTTADVVNGSPDVEKGAITFELGGDRYVWYYYEK